MALAALLAAVSACGPSNLRRAVKRFREAGKVFALVDGKAFAARLDKAFAEEGKVTVKNAPAPYLSSNGLLLLYTDEDLVPPLKGYSPLSPHQAAELAAQQRGGICVDPGEDGCLITLTPEETAAMAEVLHGDGVPRERFAMLVRKE